MVVNYMYVGKDVQRRILLILLCQSDDNVFMAYF